MLIAGQGLSAVATAAKENILGEIASIETILGKHQMVTIGDF